MMNLMNITFFCTNMLRSSTHISFSSPSRPFFLSSLRHSIPRAELLKKLAASQTILRAR